MENSILLNCDENECMNENNNSNSLGIYCDKEKMTLKNIVPHESILSLCYATSDRNFTDENTFMSLH